MEIIQPAETEHFMPYAPGIKVKATSDLLFISGATALPLYHPHPHQPEIHDIPEDPYEQTILTMENLKRVLDTAGATFQDLVLSTIFVTDMTEQGQIGKAIGKYAQGHFPVGTMVEVTRLVVLGLKVEINAIAEMPS